MMKKTWVLMSFFCGMLAALSAADLRQNFVNPPDSARPQFWWHWVGRMVTAKGITADLEAMKQAGFSTAHIFTVFDDKATRDWPEVMTPEWRELFKHAAKEADRTGMKLGMNNCPGWTCSGGPWVKPEYSMKKLVYSAAFVKGGTAGTVKLVQPDTLHNFYKDVAVLAFPAVQAIPQPQAAIDLPGLDASILTDGRVDREMPLPVQKKDFHAVITLTYPEAVFARSMLFFFGKPSIFIDIEIESSPDGKTFTPAAHQMIRATRDRGDARSIALNQGKGVRGKVFRITLRHGNMPDSLGDRRFSLREIALTADPMIENIASRNGMGHFYNHSIPAKIAKERGIDPAKVLNVTSSMQPDGSFDTAKLPAGSWQILRIGMTTTGATNRPSSLEGLECDKFSKQGLDAHWAGMMDVLLKDIRGTKSLVSSTIDSYEVGGQTWTDDFPAEFQKRRGYDILPYLPAVFGYVVGTRAESNKFLYDFQRTQSELYAENYFDYFTELCHKNGLKSCIEPYWGPFDQIRVGRSADIPMGEFWISYSPWMTKLPVVVGNVAGKGTVGAESFTSGGKSGRWQQDPAILKRVGDRMWLDGISLFIIHTYTHQPFLNVAPGRSMGGHGSHLNRFTPWWSMARAWTDYVARGQFLLQQGTRAADLLILAGESNPNDTPHLPQLYAAGFDADYCSWHDLMERLVVKDGKVGIRGGRMYSVFSLGRDRSLSLATLKKVEKLLEDGAVIAGLPPAESPTLADRGHEAEYQTVKKRLWGDGKDKVRKIGNGTLIAADDPVRIMRLAKIPARWKCAPALGVLARETAESGIYFLRRRDDGAFTGKVALQAAPGQIPEFWDAETGTMAPVPVWQRKGNMIELPLELADGESRFVVMVPGKAEPAVREVMDQPVRLELTSAVYRAKGSTDGKDVLDRVQKLRKGGTFVVTNGTMGGDSAPMKHKELFISGTADGHPFTMTIAENDAFTLAGIAKPHPAVFEKTADGKVFCRFHQPGTMTFVTADGKNQTLCCEKLPEPFNLQKAWTVRFEKEPELTAPVQFPELISWSGHTNPVIKYFSGTAVYEKTFTLPENMFAGNQRLVLDLGIVQNVAGVTVNGKSAGTWWHAPYRKDVTELLKTGENKLVIRVANLWPNRLIGDRRVQWKDPISKGYIPDWVRQDLPRSPSGRRTWTNYYGWKADEKLLPAGLIGPVMVRIEQCMAVRLTP